MARKAFLLNKVPIGSILVKNNFEIGSSFNLLNNEYFKNKHAEVNLFKQTSFYVSNYNLINSKLYVTLEPCYLCLPMIFSLNIKKIIFASYYKKKYQYYSIKKKNNYYIKIKLEGGFLKEKTTFLLKSFFSQQC